MLRAVLHTFSDEAAAAVLRRVRQAIGKRKARLVVLDHVVASATAGTPRRSSASTCWPSTADSAVMPPSGGGSAGGRLHDGGAARSGHRAGTAWPRGPRSSRTGRLAAAGGPARGRDALALRPPLSADRAYEGAPGTDRTWSPFAAQRHEASLSPRPARSALPLRRSASATGRPVITPRCAWARSYRPCSESGRQLLSASTK
ncbi:hypothetical protein [Streptomyces spirodelae]|uniref:hypothetical protein n=1 Tax=Streptomyces spirodelae TaxID=2812904 RepID=UPI0035580094